MRVGFLGCAHVHAAAYCTQLARDEIPATATAVFDHDEQRARAFAHEWTLEAKADPETLCASVDAVIVTSEHAHYAPLVQAAARAGRPVLCEKPLGVSPEAAQSIQDAGAWLSMALPVRYSDAVRQAREVVQDGALGPLLAMSGVNHAPFPGGFFGSAALAGGGAILDHVVHLADALSWMTGCRYASVYAEAGDRLGVGDVEDVAQVTVRTTDGAWASIDSSWSRPVGMAGANDFKMRLWFEQGQLAVDAFARHATLVRPGGHVAHLDYGPTIDFGLIHDWVRAIADGEAPPIPAEDGWRASQVAFAALESSQTGTTVQLAHQGRLS